MINFDDFKHNLASLPVDALEKQKYLKQLEECFYNELKSSETAQAYFNNYRPDCIETFIKTYATRKVHLVQCQEFYSGHYHEKEISELHFQKKAGEMLELILQKKMFNLQLRWRAGQLVIDGVDITYDFEFWGKHVLACPFIPAITRREVELIKEYLLQFNEDDEIDEHYYSWQDYDELTRKSEDGLMDDYPGWYEFYDSRMGTGALLILPDHKGTMENFYLDLIRKPLLENYIPSVNPEPAPYLFAWREDLFDFAKHFETDKYFRALFKYYRYYDEKENRRPNYDDLEQAIRFLLKADRPVYLKAHLTWDNAILAAVKEYQNTKIVEALDFAYEQYLLMRDLGFSMGKTLEEVKAEYDNNDIVKIYRKNILDGRLLNGEPEDFNY
jgi:hypothetical protein